jgi:hypothetical protein
MRPHVSAEKLAAWRQGDLSPRRSARIRAHLAGCARCRARSEDLAAVTTLLASVPPPPMPDHLAARIQTALATEASRRVTQPAGQQTAPAPAAPAPAAPAPAAPAPAAPATPGGPSGRPRPHRPGGQRGTGGTGGSGRPRRTVVLRGLAAAAAVVLLGGGAYEVVHSSGGSPSSSSPSGPVAAPAAGAAGKSPAAQAGPLSRGQALFGPTLRYTHAGRQASVTPITTDTNYSAGKLNSQVSAEVSKYGAGSPNAGRSAMSPNQNRTPASEPGRQSFGNIPLSALQGCVNRVAAGELVLLVDVARYRDAPATIIVTEAVAAGPEQIWVVGPGCSASHGDVLEHTTATTAG